LNWLEQYLLAERIKDAEVWQALRKRQWVFRNPTLVRLLERIERNFGRMQSLSGWMELFSLIGRRIREQSPNRS
jgi:hypothetical protein